MHAGLLDRGQALLNMRRTLFDKGEKLFGRSRTLPDLNKTLFDEGVFSTYKTRFDRIIGLFGKGTTFVQK